MNRLIAFAAITLMTSACASAASETEVPVPQTQTQAQAQPAATGLAIYEGTYALQGPNRVVDLRVWVDDMGKLNGEVMGQETVFRPSGEHKFLHGTNDQIWVVFTIENGRATSAMLHQRGFEVSGARKN